MTDYDWAARAFTQSFLDSYKTLYGCQTCLLGEVNSLRYSKKVLTKMEECEVFSLVQDPSVVLQEVAKLPLSAGERYSLNIFHSESDTEAVGKRFESAGFHYAFTNVVRGLPLPAARSEHSIQVNVIVTPDQIRYVNLSHQFFQPVPDAVLNNPAIRAFYADLDGQAAGWGLLVTTEKDAAYISDMFTLPSFRGRGVAEALLGAMHQAAEAAGKRYCLLVPSIMAWNYYQRYGYETLVCFSIFHRVTEPPTL